MKRCYESCHCIELKLWCYIGWKQTENALLSNSIMTEPQKDKFDPCNHTLNDTQYGLVSSMFFGLDKHTLHTFHSVCVWEYETLLSLFKLSQMSFIVLNCHYFCLQPITNRWFIRAELHAQKPRKCIYQINQHIMHRQYCPDVFIFILCANVHFFMG